MASSGDATQRGEPTGSPTGERILRSNVADWDTRATGGRPVGRPFDVAPTISDCYGHAWRQMWRYFWRLIVIGIVYFVLTAVLSGVLGGITGSMSASSPNGNPNVVVTGFVGLLSTLLSVFVSIPLSYGVAYVFVRAARDEPPQVSDLFEAFRSAYWPSIANAILLGIIVGLGYILFIIPGIILSIRLSFASFLVVDEHFGPWEAITESWRRTRGYSWTIIGMALLAIGISIVGLILLVIGIIPASLLIYLAFATLYTAATAHPRETL